MIATQLGLGFQQGPMAHQMAQEGAHWPSSVIRLGQHWHNSKITRANIVNGVLNVGTKHNKITISNMVGTVECIGSAKA